MPSADTACKCRHRRISDRDGGRWIDVSTTLCPVHSGRPPKIKLDENGFPIADLPDAHGDATRPIKTTVRMG